jgi:phosphoglycolate/pyridoxal phosphate phosphatase family enzyme
MKHKVFDMDGVLFRMDDPLPGAAEAVQRLRSRGERVFFLTNNSSKSRDEYVTKLARFDIPSSPDEIVTSAYATALLFAESGQVGKGVFVVGEAGLKRELSEGGMRIVEDPESEQPDFVVAGWDRQFTYAKMAAAQQAILRGAAFIATNRDKTYPDSGGRVLPGGGAIVAAIETCSGVVPRTIGKPEPYTLELILRLAGATPEDCLVIGDRLDTDIAIGKAVGARTALVLTGISTRAEAESAPPECKPDLIWNDLTEMP